MNTIAKARREWFGAVVYLEHPGMTAFVNAAKADSLGIPAEEGLPQHIFRAPLDVHLAITHRCNLHCHGCYAIDRREAAPDMPLTLARTILDHLAALDVFTVALGGGEPFLHPHLFDIANHARVRRIVPNITTNGLLIDAAAAKACGVFGNVHLSCHHPSELDRLQQAVACLRKEGIRPGLNVLVSSETFHHLADIWKWCARQRIHQVLVLKFKLTVHNMDSAAMRLTVDQESELLPLVARLSRKYHVLPMLDCSLFPALARHRPRKRDLEFFDVNGCLGGNAYLAVGPDGSYRPCSFAPQAFGKIEALDRARWMSDPQLQAFRNAIGPHCGVCGYRNLCHGGCRVCGSEACVCVTEVSNEAPRAER